MAEEQSEGGPFDLDKLKELIELMETHGLTEVSLQQGEQRWKLRRGYDGPVPMAPASYALPAAPAAPATGGAASAEPDDTIAITSPTVGTFYTAPSPEDPPFVTVGARVNPDTIVCVVEAMKVFNQIPAEVSGTIAKVLVNNGDSVEFGQPLFRVRPN
jgi:acetyl-CoA carboxylase biotin carboxyl carrier protein